MASTKGRRQSKAARIEELEAKLAEVATVARIQSNLATTYYDRVDAIAALGDLAADWQRERAERDLVLAETYAFGAAELHTALGTPDDQLPDPVLRCRGEGRWSKPLAKVESDPVVDEHYADGELGLGEQRQPREVLFGGIVS